MNGADAVEVGAISVREPSDAIDADKRAQADLKFPLRWHPAGRGNRSRVQFATFDVAYLKRLQDCDGDTERHFQMYFSELLTLKLRLRLSSRQAVEDVRQETFVRVLALIRRSDGVKHAERLGALVNSVCEYVLLEHYRDTSTSRRTSLPLDEVAEGALHSDQLTLSQQFERDEAQRLVRTILEELPERDRQVLYEVLLTERDKNEVCAEMGISRDHLRVMIHRAKQSFKAHFRRRLGESG